MLFFSAASVSFCMPRRLQIRARRDSREKYGFTGGGELVLWAAMSDRMNCFGCDPEGGETKNFSAAERKRRAARMAEARKARWAKSPNNAIGERGPLTQPKH